MTALDTARMFSVMLWLTVVVLRAPNIYRVVRGRARHFDILWSLVGGFAISTLLFNLRWYLPFDTQAIWVGLHLFSSAIAVSAIAVVALYDSSDRRA